MPELRVALGACPRLLNLVFRHMPAVIWQHEVEEAHVDTAMRGLEPSAQSKRSMG